jgi:hypothetical protein
MPLCSVRCDATLTPLPIHLSWRDDPAASAAGQVVDSVLASSRRPAAGPAPQRPSSKKAMTP